MKRKRRTKVQQEKRRILLETILDKWVCFKQVVDNEDRYIYMKHKLRDGKSTSKIEQIILSDNPVETGVYYITDYEIDRVLDMNRNMEMIQLSPVRYDMEIGMFSDKTRFDNLQDLLEYLVNENYVTEKEVLDFTNNNKINDDIEEVSLSFVTNDY